MLGFAQAAPSMTVRVTEAECSVADLYNELSENNERMLNQTKPSDDPELDSASWAKTLADVEMHAVSGPFYDLDTLHPSTRPNFN